MSIFPAKVQFCETTCEIPPGQCGMVKSLSFDEATGSFTQGPEICATNPWSTYRIAAGQRAMLVWENDHAFVLVWELS